MKKLIFPLIVIAILSVTLVSATPTNPGIIRVFVHSDNPIIRGLLDVQHEFPNGFSAKVSEAQLGLLNVLGIETEQVQLYHVTGRPTCNDNGVCEPELGENPSCGDCKPSEEEPPANRTCYPDNQMPWGILRVNGGSGGADIDVAILDTGVYREHLDLTRRIEQCKDFTMGPRVKGSCKDIHGHGTHVAGTVAADGGEDGLGIFGVAPEADILAYKVCGSDGYCWTDDVAAGIRYAATHGAEIISISLGGDSQSSLIKDAIDFAVSKGALLVAAAGNTGPSEGSILYPAANVKVIAVGAINSAENVASWSSRGVNDGDYIIEEKEVEFGAPGVSIESTYINGCYGYKGGTSMAAPHISGLAAKLWQGNAADTRTYLQSIAKDIWTAGDDSATGFGLPIAP